VLEEGGFVLSSLQSFSLTMLIELKFAHAALIDPYDQSLWFHHQNLICIFDPSLAAHTMAPNLSNAERLEYVRQEKEAIQDMLDGDEDCKWIYEALIHCDLVAAKIEGTMSTHTRTEVSQWLDELMKLDPLRKNRWLDLAMSIKR
jgi:geranylgeranyl transferase type-2 subunit alpha